MSFVEKLLEIFHIEINKLKEVKIAPNLRILSDNNFSKTENHTHINIVVNSKKEIESINYEALSQQERDALVKLLLNENRVMLIPSNIYPKLEEAKDYVKSPKNPTLTYFESKLLPEDVRILRSADFIKSLYDSGKTSEITQLKKQLAEVYGQKVNVICNLYTAGYFETFLTEKYEDMAQEPNFTPSDFHDLYRSLISDFPVAIFVSSGTTATAVEKQILGKLERIKESKLNYLNIHGIGEENIATIESILDREEISSMIASKSVFKTARTIVLRLVFNL